jgi:hypothetical protein
MTCAMPWQKAGVVGAPEVQYLEDARSVHRTSAD